MQKKKKKREKITEAEVIVTRDAKKMSTENETSKILKWYLQRICKHAF